MEKEYTKMPDKCEDHFNIIKLCLGSNTDVASEDKSAGDDQGNKEPENENHTPKNGDEEVESTDDEKEGYEAMLAMLKQQIRTESADATKTTAPVQVQAAAETLAPVEAFAEDIQKIQKFMNDYVTFYNQNPQPWKEDLERIEQEHKRQLQECQTEIAGLRELNQELARDVTFKMEQLKLCDDWRQREHSELMQIIDDKSQQIDNLEKEQQNVKTCLKAFEGLYKNLYEDINRLKSNSVESTTQAKANPNSEVERKQMREETVALVRQEVISRMDAFLGGAFQNLRIMSANETVAAKSAMALVQKPAPPNDTTGMAMMPRQQQQANSNETSQALQSLMEVNTNMVQAAEQRGQMKQPYVNNYKTKFKKQNFANTPRPKPQASGGGDPRFMPLQQSHPNLLANGQNSAAVDPRLMMQPNLNDPRLLLQLLQSNTSAQSILGQPQLMQLPTSNIAGGGGGGDNVSLGEPQQQQQPRYKQANKQPHSANV